MTRREALAVLAAPMAAGAAHTRVGLGFSLYGTKNLPVPEAIRICAGIGYDGVELCLNPGWSDPPTLSPGVRREIRDALVGNRMSLLSMMDKLSLLDREMTRDAGVERIRRAAELGHSLMTTGRPIVETVVGGKSAEWESQKENMAARLRVWAETAQAGDITICVKAHAGAAVDTPERLLWIYQQAANSVLKLTYDYSHFVVRGLGLPQTLHQLIAQSAFISVKDAAGTPEHPRFLLAGDGGTDYGAYFRYLKSAGYSGPVVVEVSAQLQVLTAYDPVAAARKCYPVLADAMASAGLERTGKHS